MSDYAAWRISYQTSEQAAKAAYEQTQEQKARIAELEAQLIAEAARTAEQKLRADQLEQQHAMQAKMHAQAAEQLAAAQQGVQPAWFVQLTKYGEPVQHLLPEIAEKCRADIEKIGGTLRPLYTHPTTQGMELDSKLREEAKSAAMLLCAEAAALCGNQLEQGCARCDAVTVLAAHHDFSDVEFNHLFLNANLGKKDSYSPKFFSINVFDEVAAQDEQGGAA